MLNINYIEAQPANTIYDELFGSPVNISGSTIYQQATTTWTKKTYESKKEEKINKENLLIKKYLDSVILGEWTFETNTPLNFGLSKEILVFISFLKKQRIFIENTKDLFDYLLRNTEMMDKLLKAIVLIRARIEDDSCMIIKLYKDAESQDCNYLKIIVRLKKYFDNFSEILDEVNTDFFPFFEQNKGYFVILTDYKYCK